MASTDLVSFYVLLSQCTSCDNTPDNGFKFRLIHVHISSYSRARAL